MVLMAARAGVFQQLGFQRIIDDVADRRVFRQRRQIDIQRRIAAHAGAGGIDHQRGVAGDIRPIVQRCRAASAL